MSEKLPQASFDVRDQLWLGGLTLEGETIELGLRQVLQRAHELRSVGDPLPTVECGVLRLLVALVLDIFAPRHTNELADLIEAKKFDDAKIQHYFDRHADRFDLFDPQHPFLQTPMEGDKEKPIAGLLSLIPSGTNALHFHHAQEDELAVSPAVGVRLLTTIAPFMTAGGAGLPPSINGAPPFYVVVQGENLFQTILLNCPADEGLLPHAQRKGDLPLWRSNEPVQAKEQREAGVLQSLTWAPRRIQLIAGAGGRCALTGKQSPILVRAMKFAPGWSCRLAGWTDPNVPYRTGEKDRLVLRPQEERPLWRDAGPLALLREGDYQSQTGQKFRFERPAVVSQFAQMERDGELPAKQKLKLRVYGVRTDLKMKVFEWHRADLRLPLPLVMNGDFASRAQSEVDKADMVAYSIGRAVKRAYPREGAGNSAAFNDRIARAKRFFWDALEPHFLGAPNSLLENLARLQNGSDAEREARITKWRKTVENIGKDALEEAIGDLDTDADALERQVAARNLFASSVRNALFPPTAEELEERNNKKKKTSAKKGAAHVAS